MRAYIAVLKAKPRSQRIPDETPTLGGLVLFNGGIDLSKVPAGLKTVPDTALFWACGTIAPFMRRHER